MLSLRSEKPSFATQDIGSFGRHLYKSKRILALCGAGLSAASGIPTFRGSGAMSTWRGHKASSLSSIDAFNVNPGLVWQYMADRRHLALQSKPNKAHKALAQLAKKKKGFVCLTQNIDGMLVEWTLGSFLLYACRAFPESRPSERAVLFFAWCVL
jgi:NAD-dependent deacetylase sirtuin 5